MKTGILEDIELEHNYWIKWNILRNRGGTVVYGTKKMENVNLLKEN